MQRLVKVSVVGIGVWLLWAGAVGAREAKTGQRVVVIKDKAQLAVSGQPAGTVRECTVFTVDKVDGEWLWIKSEKAYLRRADVVPFEEAIGHYTRRLESNKTAGNYWNRAQIWRLKGELDIALGDMNEALRLNPNVSAGWPSLLQAGCAAQETSERATIKKGACLSVRRSTKFLGPAAPAGWPRRDRSKGLGTGPRLLPDVRVDEIV